MPNTRELELWRLVNKAFQNSIEKFGDIFAKDVTRDLLDSGVTVQQWISVKDRLPAQTDPATAVLGITERGRCHIVYYFKGVTSEEFTGFYDICAKREITHWMPLPPAPKGE